MFECTPKSSVIFGQVWVIDSKVRDRWHLNTYVAAKLISRCMIANQIGILRRRRMSTFFSKSFFSRFYATQSCIHTCCHFWSQRPIVTILFIEPSVRVVLLPQAQKRVHRQEFISLEREFKLVHYVHRDSVSQPHSTGSFALYTTYCIHLETSCFKSIIWLPIIP